MQKKITKNSQKFQNGEECGMFFYSNGIWERGNNFLVLTNLDTIYYFNDQLNQSEQEKFSLLYKKLNRDYAII